MTLTGGYPFRTSKSLVILSASSSIDINLQDSSENLVSMTFDPGSSCNMWYCILTIQLVLSKYCYGGGRVIYITSALISLSVKGVTLYSNAKIARCVIGHKVARVYIMKTLEHLSIVL